MIPQSNKQLASSLILLSLVISLILFTKEIKKVVARDPMVETGVSVLSPDGTHVGINIPHLFKMVLDTRGSFRGLRLEQTIMSGLVKILIDRELGSNGKMSGPIQVSVGSMTVYDNMSQR